MDDNNLRNLQHLKVRNNFPDKEIFLMRNFASGAAGLPVPDPYYGGLEDFEEVFTILDEAVTGLVAHLLETHEPQT